MNKSRNKKADSKKSGKNKKINKKKLIIGSIIGAVILIVIGIALALTILSIHNKKPVAAFYRIDDRTKAAIEIELQKTLEKRKTGNHLPYEIITLNSEESLEDAIKSSGKTPDLIFTYLGLNGEKAAEKALTNGFSVGTDELNELPNSIKAYARKPYADEEKTAAVPLLADHYQVDIKNSDYSKTGIKRLAVLADFEDFLSKAKKINNGKIGYSPLLIAGGDSAELLDVLQLLTEALGEENSIALAKNEIRKEMEKQTPDYSGLASRLLSNGGSFYKAATLLSKWNKMGFLPGNYLQFQKSEIIFYLSNNLVSSAILPLSVHRQVDHSALLDFTTIYMPGISENLPRNFTAPVVAVFPYGSKGPWEKFASIFVENKAVTSVPALVSRELNGTIAAKSGLAPLNKTATVVDKQADDTRYWLAASETPEIPLSLDCFTTDEKLEKLAVEIRFLLQNM